MYYVEQRYRAFGKDDIFETYEEALADANTNAGSDYEGYLFIINKIEAIVKADKPLLPTTVTEAKGEDIETFLCQKDGNEPAVQIPNL